MIPDFEADGLLPQGIHNALWQEFAERFGTTPYRRTLLSGLQRALQALRIAGCRTVYVDGSFVTTKEVPGDFDCCYDITGMDPKLLYMIDPAFFEQKNKRAAQKATYGGELFPAQGPQLLAWLDFFQTNKDTGARKGVVAIDLGSV